MRIENWKQQKKQILEFFLQENSHGAENGALSSKHVFNSKTFIRVKGVHFDQTKNLFEDK